MSNDKIRVAVIGTGNIGTDLCERLLKDPKFEVVAFVGRRSTSSGLTRMYGRVPNLLDSGIESLGPSLMQHRHLRTPNTGQSCRSIKNG